MAAIKHDCSKNSKLIADDRVLSEETIITLRKLEYDYEIGRLSVRKLNANVNSLFANGASSL